MDINKEYIKYVCIYRVYSGYKEISQIEDVKETEEDLRNNYSNIGGIDSWLCERLGIDLIILGNLKSNNKILKEKIDKLFKNQFTKSKNA